MAANNKNRQKCKENKKKILKILSDLCEPRSSISISKKIDQIFKIAKSNMSCKENLIIAGKIKLDNMKITGEDKYSEEVKKEISLMKHNFNIIDDMEKKDEFLSELYNTLNLYPNSKELKEGIVLIREVYKHDGTFNKINIKHAGW